MKENTKERSANTMKMMISHFPMVHATLPINPRSIRKMAITIKRIPRVRSQAAIQ